MTYFEMAVALDGKKIFKFCFQILKANRIVFQQYLIKFSKNSSPEAVYIIMTSSKNFFGKKSFFT